ncbi:hypothetical protein IAG44_31250 [Streptomyces roseirectus]|uniref:DUF6286 domain-containing protein n=1 Tax=Streptomyces roseirectus TaxID=2768066 RepID=A0A7H0IL23_9ACTN|nr:DUF6286 domain-containing protein [Streptomyces roseirectus]QNP73489.1 hypothetical protein IAG44_31250 [Streptomyces roseirectus]
MSEPHGSEGTTQRLPVILEKPDSGPQTPPHEPGAPAAAVRRFWSVRRAPAALTALAVLAVAGVFLYDIAAVRADRPAMRWRRELAHQLAQRPLDDTWVLTGAGVAAALGLLLLVLAVTPGHRDVLPMRPTHPDVRAGLHRDAAALVLRDRAMEVSGVQSVHVRMGRRRIDVRAVSHFRDLDDVRADLEATLGAALDGLALAHPPALSAHVRRPPRKKG